MRRRGCRKSVAQGIIQSPLQPWEGSTVSPLHRPGPGHLSGEAEELVPE